MSLENSILVIADNEAFGAYLDPNSLGESLSIWTAAGKVTSGQGERKRPRQRYTHKISPAICATCLANLRVGRGTGVGFGG